MTGARDLPPPLPPETRTIGQVVAESVRLYQRRFWPSLSLGLPVAAVDGIALALPDRWPIVFVPVAGAVLLSASFIGASALAADVRPDRRSILVGLAVGALVFLPFPFLVLGFVLPGLAWLAFLGLSVPTAVIERLGVRASLRRAVQLARADYIHVLGGLATLAIVVFLTRSVLFFLLRDAGDNTSLIAFLLADIVISPVLFLGGALLYFDQAARVTRGKPRAAR